MAFLIPILELLIRRKKSSPWKPNEVGAVIISPTRELATQTSDVLSKFLKHPELSNFQQKLLVGGNSVEEDVDFIQKNGIVILICTPGRMVDLLERKGSLNLAGRVKSLEILILDEADRLLDLGFTTSLNTIFSYMPRQRRTGLFSATQTKEIGDLVRAGLRNPVLVSVQEKAQVSTPISLENFYCIVEPEQKFNYFLAFMRKYKIQKAMLFLPTCACVEYWAEILPKFLKETKILALHGKMKKRRTKILESFRVSNEVLLLCTDVLARGVDIPEMDWVIQWDPPSNAAAFVHRVGRTARQGQEGNALIMILPTEDSYIEFLKRNQKVLLKPISLVESVEDLADVNKKIHQLQFKDRSIFDKGNKAFVSHVRAYSKHECSILLKVRDLNLGKIATSYGLIKLPLMPEIKPDHKKEFIGPSSKFDYFDISYKNKQKEDSRQTKLVVYKETGQWPGAKPKKKKTLPWEQSKIKKDDKKTNKTLRKEKNKLIKEAVENQTAKKKKRGFDEEDLAEIAKDIALFKKFKKKKITEEEFDKEIGFDSE